MSMREQEYETGQEQGGVGGGWLGTYAYKGLLRVKPPVRFEATFTEPDGEGAFLGTILDDSGGLSEADVNGQQSGRGIRFSKVYRRGLRVPISYEGTLADDGRTMQGTWRIADDAYGVWDARRLWAESAGSADTEETEGREQERVGELVRLG